MRRPLAAGLGSKKRPREAVWSVFSWGRGVAAARVGAVQFTQHLPQHLGEVIVVPDMGQEAGIGIVVALPVHAMEVRHIELLVHRALPGKAALILRKK